MVPEEPTPPENEVTTSRTPTADESAPGEVRPSELPSELSILPLRSAVLFPGVMMPITVGRERSLRLIDAEVESSRWVGFVAQQDDQVEEPGDAHLHRVGTAGVIVKMLRPQTGSLHVQIQGMQRFRIKRIIGTDPWLRAEVEPIVDRIEDATMVEALRRSVADLFLRLVAQGESLPVEVQGIVRSIEDAASLVDFIASSLSISVHDKQRLLEPEVVDERLRRLVEQLGQELRVQELGQQIQKSAKAEMDKRGREVYLREQLKAIRAELGEGSDQEESITELAKKIDAAGMPPDAERAARDELERLRAMNPGAAEYSVSRTYLDWLVSLPWSKSTPDALDLKEARRILDEDHLGLDKVKERILEFLAVVKLKGEVRGSILCLAGPPGVGKTSLGRSIARAMGREFVRISLGGVRDEAEIRGHRRTYVGALPGRIIQEMKRAATNNPVFLLDEIDKLGADSRGDPSAALLEVLDPEQNATFVDHYLDLPFDLSKVLFIATANVLDTIPAPLRDRTEIINLPGYTEEEKLGIAQQHLVARVTRDAGLQPDTLTFDDDALRAITRDYTRENGLRGLVRELSSVARKVARACAEGECDAVQIGAKDIGRYLGPAKYHAEIAERTSEPGVATGLAWTAVGGEILFVEAARLAGDSSFILTGQLGDVMKESARIALSVVRARAQSLGIPEDTFARSQIHIHVPAGAVPKDGPSAGVTMVAAITSLLLARPVRSDLAMTGEVTLRGRVMPVGGIREKVLAAARAGIKTILLPRWNEK
ncbi:MAG: endopeptidase La, partial [Planctomycetes bacterium]|nr:endopeptidase La [Planctomycetota bacterium]